MPQVGISDLGYDPDEPAETARDRNVEAVRARLLQRSKVGILKYGTTTERTDWSSLDRLRHAQEEALDLAVYLEAEIQKLTLAKAGLPAKGEKGGECNRTICRSENALWWNKSTRRYYCEACARRIMSWPENKGLLVEESPENAPS